MNESELPANTFELSISRFVPALPQHVFDAWTDPVIFAQWWGPKNVICRSVEIDSRSGGRYRIEHEMPDGTSLFITGQYKVFDRPHQLNFSWLVETKVPTEESVDVRFSPTKDGTVVTIRHTRISSQQLARSHQYGWEDCLSGLATHFSSRNTVQN